MVELLVGGVAYVVNVAVSFMTDGTWKTAGTSVIQFYLRVAEWGRQDWRGPIRTQWRYASMVQTGARSADA